MIEIARIFPKDEIPEDVTLLVQDDGTVWVLHTHKYGIYRDPRDVPSVTRIDRFISETNDCWRLRCLLCDGKGYVWTGGDFGSGGPCRRCDQKGFDPNPDEAAEYRDRWDEGTYEVDV